MNCPPCLATSRPCSSRSLQRGHCSGSRSGMRWSSRCSCNSLNNSTMPPGVGEKTRPINTSLCSDDEVGRPPLKESGNKGPDGAEEQNSTRNLSPARPIERQRHDAEQQCANHRQTVHEQVDPMRVEFEDDLFVWYEEFSWVCHVSRLQRRAVNWL